MDTQQMLLLLPGMQPDEFLTVQAITKGMTDTQQQQFVAFYGSRRRQAQSILILTLVGFLGVAGIQRFLLGDIGLGILYLLTGGLCGIGTIIDLVNNQKLTSEYNQKAAAESANLVRML